MEATTKPLPKAWILHCGETSHYCTSREMANDKMRQFIKALGPGWNARMEMNGFTAKNPETRGSIKCIMVECPDGIVSPSASETERLKRMGADAIECYYGCEDTIGRIEWLIGDDLPMLRDVMVRHGKKILERQEHGEPDDELVLKVIENRQLDESLWYAGHGKFIRCRECYSW